MDIMIESRESSKAAIKRGTDLAGLWVTVEKKLEGRPKLNEVYNIAKKEHLKEYMGQVSRNGMGTENRRILDNISRFIEKYAPLSDIIKSVDNKQHHAQLGYGIFTLLWLMTGATTTYTIYLEEQLKLMSKSLQDIPQYESLWHGAIDGGEMLSRTYDVYEAFVLFVAECYKHYSSSRVVRSMRSMFLTKSYVEGKAKAFDDTVRRVLEHSRYLHEKHAIDQAESDLLSHQDTAISQISKFVEPHGSHEKSDPEKYLSSIQRNKEPSHEQDDPDGPETGEIVTLDRAENFEWWKNSHHCAMLLLKAQNYWGTGPWEPLWISDAIAKYTCVLETSPKDSRVIFRAIDPGEDISGFMALIITSLLRWNQGFFKDHAQHNTELIELLDIISQRSYETQNKTRELLEPMKSLLRTWFQQFPGFTITIIACDFHNYAEHWGDKDKRPPSTIVDFIDALLQVMRDINSADGRLKVCLVVKSHAWPETLQDKIEGQCGQHITKLERVLRVAEMVQGQRGFG